MLVSFCLSVKKTSIRPVQTTMSLKPIQPHATNHFTKVHLPAQRLGSGTVFPVTRRSRMVLMVSERFDRRKRIIRRNAKSVVRTHTFSDAPVNRPFPETTSPVNVRRSPPPPRKRNGRRQKVRKPAVFLDWEAI